MRTSLRKVGNSRGIIIPAALLAECGLSDEVELTVQGKKLLVEAVNAPRTGWFTGYQAEAGDEDTTWLSLPVSETDDEEWVW